MRWRLLLAMLFGGATIFVGFAGGMYLMTPEYTDNGIFCLFSSIMLMLCCVIFAQDDGRDN
jgi:hypothetical protein